VVNQQPGGLMIPKKLDSNDYYMISGSIFGLVAFMHLLRILNNWVFIFGTWHFHYWVSWVAMPVAAYLSYQAFLLAGVIKKPLF
jgi:hypothetical protein